VHPTHYGRVCRSRRLKAEHRPDQLDGAVRTPERVRFLETPYRKVEKGHVTTEISYLSAIEEGKYVIAQANAPLDKTASSWTSWSAAVKTVNSC